MRGIALKATMVTSGLLDEHRRQTKAENEARAAAAPQRPALSRRQRRAGAVFNRRMIKRLTKDGTNASVKILPDGGIHVHVGKPKEEHVHGPDCDHKKGELSPDKIAKLQAMLEKNRFPIEPNTTAELADENDPDGYVVIKTAQGRPIMHMPRELWDYFREHPELARS